jgi:putative membrane protein
MDEIGVRHAPISARVARRVNKRPSTPAAGGDDMIDAVLQSLLGGLPKLLGHFAAAAAIHVAGMAIYLRLTPYHELDLVRGGNVAAALTLAGAAVGLAIPLATTLATSVNVVDILVWGGVSALLQAAAFGAATLALRDLPARVERGDVAAAVIAASTQIAVGILNAGAMVA